LVIEYVKQIDRSLPVTIKIKYRKIFTDFVCSRFALNSIYLELI